MNQVQHGTIYHTWEWQNILSEAFGWKIIRLFCRGDDKIIGVYPMAIITPSSQQLPWEQSNYPLAVSLPPNNFGGPVFAGELTEEMQKIVLKKMILKMEKILVNHHCYKIEIRPSPWDCFIEGIFPSIWDELGYEVNKHMPTFVLNLKKPINEIQNDYRRTTIDSIRQGKKRGTRIVPVENKKKF